MDEKQELYEKTKQLLRDLNYFLAHIVIYFVCNAALTFVIFKNITERWWMFFFVFLWALGVIYHALKVYGIDLLGDRRNKLSKMWSWV